MVPWEAARPEAYDASGMRQEAKGRRRGAPGRGRGARPQKTHCVNTAIFSGAAGVGPWTPQPPEGRTLTSALVESTQLKVQSHGLALSEQAFTVLLPAHCHRGLVRTGCLCSCF